MNEEGGECHGKPGQVKIGDAAPAFSVSLDKQQMVSLEILGVSTYLRWISGPAGAVPANRHRSPFLKAANEKFKDKNFVLIGVSLDSKKKPG